MRGRIKVQAYTFSTAGEIVSVDHEKNTITVKPNISVTGTVVGGPANVEFFKEVPIVEKDKTKDDL